MQRLLLMVILILGACVLTVLPTPTNMVSADDPTPPASRTPPPTPDHGTSSAPGYPPSNGGSLLYESIQHVTYSFGSDGRMQLTVDIFIANPTGCTVGVPCPEYDDSPEYVNAWVDWDGDKSFEPGEKVLDQAGTGYANINYSGTMSFHATKAVPEDAASTTYMRVNLGWDHDPNDPNELYWTWGDIQDYKVDFAAWRSGIQEGDILLHREAGLLTWIGYWTHAGMYVGDGKLVEAVPSGVKYSEVSEWDYPRDHTVEMLRVSGASSDQINKAIAFVKSQVNKPYHLDWWGKDSDSSSDSWYCSELVWAAYKNQGIDIENTPDPGWVTPTEIHNDSDTYRVSGHGRMDDGVVLRQDSEPNALVVVAHSPVDLVVTDPDGIVLGKDTAPHVEEGTYIEADIDEDGELEDLVIIHDRKIGQYAVAVTSEPGALPTDTFTLEISAYGASSVVAENVQLGDISADPYIIESTDIGVVLPPPADDTPPTTTISLDPALPDGANGWYVSPVTVILTAEDDPGGSGVASTEYRLDGGPWQPYVGPFTLSTDGITTVEARSTDNAGNVESPGPQATVQIDQIAPTVSVEVPAESVAVQDGVTLEVCASDVTSGLADVRLYLREDDGGSGIAVGFENLPATYNSGTGHWEHWFDSTLLPDGYYVVLARAEDNAGNEAWSAVRHFSIRNWAVLELLPASESNKAGRTMPVKFSLRIAAAVDPAQPFIYNEDLTIKIYETSHSGDVLQTSMYGDTSRDYRINGELYITNFKTLKTPKDYTVDIWRHNTIDFLVGSFGFSTVK